VRIGGVMPLSRPGFLEAGRHLKAGLELAVADINKRGGVGGCPLELVVRDTGAGPESAAAIVDELDQAGVVAIVGEYHSVVARAISERAAELELPFVCSSAVLDALTDEPTEWVARIAPAQSHCWQVYADYLVEAGHHRVALLSEPNLYWSTGAGILHACLGNSGVGIADVHAASCSASDIAARLAADYEASAAVLLVGYPEPAVSIVKAIRANPALSGMTIGDPAGRAEFSAWSELLGSDGLEVPFLRYLPSHLPEAGHAIKRRLTQLLTEAPSFVAFEAYDAITVLLAALEAGGDERQALASSFGELTVAGTRGDICFRRVADVSVWQWAWPPVQVAARVQTPTPEGVSVLHTQEQS
jgi:ABC-type branched-subunit amino acid transport system substrate-binding protein